MGKFFAVIVLAFIVLTGLYLWTFVFPYHFSSQAPIDVTKLTGRYEPGQAVGIFHGEKVSVPTQNLALDKPLLEEKVLGVTNANKRIEIDLTNQRLYAFEGDRKVFDFLVSTGKWGLTPTGNFMIWIKLRYVRMTGGSQALGTFYDLPNVPFTMFLYNDQTPKWKGYGIHGAYWHNNFGHPMSHGCINMRIADAEQLYYWANPDLRGLAGIQATSDNPGTPVIIYGTTPQS